MSDLNEIRKIIRRVLHTHLLMEGKAFPFTLDTSVSAYADNIYYTSVINGITYEISFLHKPKQFSQPNFGEYTAMFRTNSGDFTERVKKDISHFNDVMETIGLIIQDAVSKFKIRKITFSGEADADVDKNLSYIDVATGKQNTTRTNYYVRFFKSKYPSESITMEGGNKVSINMKLALPQFFGDDNSYESIEIFIDELAGVLRDPYNKFNDFKLDGLNTDYYHIYYSSDDGLETLEYVDLNIEYVNEKYTVDITLGEDKVNIYEELSNQEEVVELISDQVQTYRENHKQKKENPIQKDIINNENELMKFSNSVNIDTIKRIEKLGVTTLDNYGNDKEKIQLKILSGEGVDDHETLDRLTADFEFLDKKYSESLKSKYAHI